MSPLFPGDGYGQQFAGCPQPQMMPYGFNEFQGVCGGGDCSGCGGDASGFDMSACGCSSCGPNMSGMGMPMQDGGGCGCGSNSSHSMPSPSFTPHQDMTPMPMNQGVQNGTPAPLPPAEVFPAPSSRPSEGILPPVPSDPAPSEGAPPASPAVDPVSWEVPAFPPMTKQTALSTQNTMTHRAEPIPTAINR